MNITSAADTSTHAVSPVSILIGRSSSMASREPLRGL